MTQEQQTACASNTVSLGFSLIELLVVIVIIGILATVAYPSYSQYVVRGKLTEAHSLLADYRVRLEQYYQDHRAYAPANGNCGAAAPESQYFQFGCVAASDAAGQEAQTYTASATNRAGQGLGAAGDYVYTINELNARATTSFPGVAGAKPCWLVKGDEC